MTPDPDLSKLSGEMYRHWEKAMKEWWDQVLESPAFLSAMGDSLSARSQARARYEEAVDASMEQLHLPGRKDMVRLARLVSVMEDRLLEGEDRLLRMQDRLDDMEREVLKARVEAAEARVELREQLARLEERLAAKPAPRKGGAKGGEG